MKEKYLCFSLKLAGFLMDEGFVLLGTEKDKKSSRKIYIFNRSANLEETVEKYRALKGGRK